MEGTEVTPTPESGGDFDSILNEALGTDEDVQDTQEAEDAPEPSQEPPKLTVPDEKKEEPESDETDEKEAEKEAPEESEEEDPFESDEDIKPVKSDEKNHYFKRAKAERLLQIRDEFNALREALPGISVDALKEYAESANTLSQLVSNYQSTDPSKVQEFASYWFGEKANPRSVAMIAATLPAALAKSHPQALASIESQVRQATVSQLMDEYRRTGNDETYALAYHLNKRFNGTELPRTQQEQPTDQLAAERARIARERKELEDQRISAATELEQRADQENLAHVDSTLDAHVDGKLKKVFEKGTFTEAVQKAIRRDLVDAWKEYVGTNQSLLEQYNTKRDAARRSPSAQSRESFVTVCRQAMDAVLRKQGRAIVNSYTKAQVEASQKEHQKLQNQQAKRNAPPASVPSSRAEDLGEQLSKGKISVDDFFDKVMGG